MLEMCCLPYIYHAILIVYITRTSCFPNILVFQQNTELFKKMFCCLVSCLPHFCWNYIFLPFSNKIFINYVSHLITNVSPASLAEAKMVACFVLLVN